MPGITLLGLGPGHPDQLTREAWQVLVSADEVWLRTRQHPSVAALPAQTRVHSFDDLFETHDTFQEACDAIVKKILVLAKRPQGVIYAVPGHPFVAEKTGPEIARIARDEGLALRIVEGLSFLEVSCSALGLDPYPRLTLIDALELSDAHVPAFSPEMPALIAQIYSVVVAAEVKATLLSVYPDTHPIRLVHAAGTSSQIVEDLRLARLDQSDHIGMLTSLYIPPLVGGTSFESLQEVMAHLRAPDGCPWDREQTHQTLRKYLLEETYETLDALDAGDFHKVQEELGDLLLQIVFHAQIAGESSAFKMADVIKGIHDKLVRRHPHVFGEIQVDGTEAVLQNWEKIKAEERKEKGDAEKSLLDGLPVALPALIQAQEYQARAARVGFDWPEIDGVLDKIAEEVLEVKQATNPEELQGELGDLFFALVNLARWKMLDAEAALRGTNLKFKKRFSFIEKSARQNNRIIQDLSLDEMEALWQQAKQHE